MQRLRADKTILSRAVVARNVIFNPTKISSNMCQIHLYLSEFVRTVFSAWYSCFTALPDLISFLHLACISNSIISKEPLISIYPYLLLIHHLYLVYSIFQTRTQVSARKEACLSYLIFGHSSQSIYFNKYIIF